jgi:hypothetical protein
MLKTLTAVGITAAAFIGIDLLQLNDYGWIIGAILTPIFAILLIVEIANMVRK